MTELSALQEQDLFADLFRQRISGPVFDFQALNPSELPHVVRHQCQSKAAGMGSNQQVIRADHGSALLQVGSNYGIVESRIAGIVQNRDMPQIHIQRCLVLPPPQRNLNSVHQFTPGNRGNADFGDRNPLQSLQDLGVAALHDVRRSICIEHVLDRQSERSCNGRSSTPSMNSSEAMESEAR